MAHRKINIDAFDQDQFVEDEDLLSASAQQDEDDNTPVAANISNVGSFAPKSASEIDKLVSECAASVRAALNK